ncbi:MAG: hypothetical protein ACE15E_20950 [Acidobacteriota bacterium]
MSRTHPQDSGFTLITVLFMILLVLSLSIYVCLMLANESNLTGTLDSQLYSLILAENGIEYARSLLPHLELDETLNGPDGKHSGTGQAEWRNPLSFDVARKVDPESWSVERDDGWPVYDGKLLLAQGHDAPGDGRFYIRFSNDPAEPAADDRDGVVLVRSMGIVRSRRNGLFEAARNNATLVEAVLRQERVFDLQAAMVLFGESGNFDLPHKGFELDGGEKPGVAGIGGHKLIPSLINSLGPGAIARIKGAGKTPSVHDMTAVYATSPLYRRVFDARFWKHFRDQLPAFTDTRLPGIRFYPEGGAITGSFEGFLVACGDFSLAGVDIEGVVLHLGGGRLTLGADATIRGAIWMSNSTGESKGQMLHEPLALKIFDSVEVIYDAGAVRRSLTLLPPTQLGWRILFPEMKL